MAENTQLTNAESSQLTVKVEGTALERFTGRDLVRELAQRLSMMHPAMKEVGMSGMLALAQMALLTGANPLPTAGELYIWEKGGKIIFDFGVQYLRGKVEEGGGIHWIERPRLLTKVEREEHNIGPNMEARICRGALRSKMIAVRRSYEEAFGEKLTVAEAAEQCAEIGIGTFRKTTEQLGDRKLSADSAPNGRSIGWTVEKRAEKDLCKRLCPSVAAVADAMASAGSVTVVHVADDADRWVGEVIPSKVQELPNVVDENDVLYGVQTTAVSTAVDLANPGTDYSMIAVHEDDSYSPFGIEEKEGKEEAEIEQVPVAQTPRAATSEQVDFDFSSATQPAIYFDALLSASEQYPSPSGNKIFSSVDSLRNIVKYIASQSFVRGLTDGEPIVAKVISLMDDGEVDLFADVSDTDVAKVKREMAGQILWLCENYKSKDQWKSLLQRATDRFWAEVVIPF